MSNADLIRGRQVVEYLRNESGVDVVEGDVVVTDTAGNDQFTTTGTNALTTRVVGIAQETIRNHSNGRVLVAGYAPLVRVNGSNTTRGRYLFTGLALSAFESATRSAGAFAQLLTGGTAPTAHLYGDADQAAAGGGSAAIICRVKRTTTQSMANDTEENVDFTAEDDDAEGWHSTVTNPNRITVDETGIFHIAATIEWQGGTGLRIFTLYKNNSTILDVSQLDLDTSQPPTQHVCTVASLTAGDYVNTTAYQNSGGALSIVSGAHFTVTKV